MPALKIWVYAATVEWLVPPVLFMTSWRFYISLLLLLALVAESLLTLNVDTAYWGHLFPGIALIRGASYVLRSDGSPIIIKLHHAVLACVVSAVMFCYSLK